ncbi:ricin B-like lectin [Trametes versicolor FP-101664 SS1]|uniref:ricin B-like lectin n=1 Tax=Trametes versicolor (strain FP-101664) TaxID=717944 RepID=UPI0004621C15|nr:ricin B-like lectin [Trametes versicolor FP-101664 SS1]EIW52696.1 ricin B-like lectin [Trametes versicolor FP-101664 SS1]
MSFEAGKTYQIINAKGGTVLDLSGGQDHSPITGYQWSGGSNQKWTLEQNGDGFQLKNAATGLYIGIDGEPSNSAPVIATSQGQHWEVKPDHSDPSVFRIFLKGTQFCLDLSDHGNPNPGTPVTLWKKWEGGTNQTWKFEEAA